MVNTYVYHIWISSYVAPDMNLYDVLWMDWMYSLRNFMKKLQ